MNKQHASNQRQEPLEANKGEAEKCIIKAVQAYKKGDKKLAEKLLLKAESLYPTDSAKELLKIMRGGSTATPQRPSSPTPEEVTRPTNSPHQTGQREYTPEQEEAVRRILKCDDLYELLGVSKDAPDSDIKTAFKKLALRLHPDKNNAPGATEAFKKINHAAFILADAEKRKKYDNEGMTPELKHSWTFLEGLLFLIGVGLLGYFGSRLLTWLTSTPESSIEYPMDSDEDSNRAAPTTRRAAPSTSRTDGHYMNGSASGASSRGSGDNSTCRSNMKMQSGSRSQQPAAARSPQPQGGPRPRRAHGTNDSTSSAGASDRTTKKSKRGGGDCDQ